MTDDWITTETRPAPAEDVMYVDVAGYEGPLDLLLDLARRQKVDLARLSMLSLAEQYLAFIDTLRERRIEVAADYLVMAAWLAYLKSRLLLPQAPDDEEPSGEMMAALLQFRLRRLEAMRRAASQLMNRPRLGFQVYASGRPAPAATARRAVWEASLYELLRAYAGQRERGMVEDWRPAERSVWSLQEARDILRRLVGEGMDWAPLEAWLARYLDEPGERVTVIASSFASSLELARQGELELRQGAAFGPLLLRRRRPDRDRWPP